MQGPLCNHRRPRSTVEAPPFKALRPKIAARGPPSKDPRPRTPVKKNHVPWAHRPRSNGPASSAKACRPSSAVQRSPSRVCQPRTTGAGPSPQVHRSWSTGPGLLAQVPCSRTTVPGPRSSMRRPRAHVRCSITAVQCPRSSMHRPGSAVQRSRCPWSICRGNPRTSGSSCCAATPANRPCRQTLPTDLADKAGEPSEERSIRMIQLDRAAAITNRSGRHRPGGYSCRAPVSGVASPGAYCASPLF